MRLFGKIKLTLRAIKNLPTFILDYFGLLNDHEVIYKTYTNQNLVTRGGSTDAGEIIIIFSDLEYPKKYFPAIHGPVILDVGANIGAFSVYLFGVLSRYDPNIYAIEPSKLNYALLVKNVVTNNLNKIESFNIAISDYDGNGLLNTKGGFDSFALSNITQCEHTEAVKVQTLETFCLENNIDMIDLLKMDIEGGEYPVFRSSIEFIKRKVKSIFIEVHNLDDDVNNIDAFETFVKKHNFLVEARIMNRTLFLRNGLLNK